MKYFLSLCCLCSLLALPVLAQSGDPEFDTALAWMYEEGMTKFDNHVGYGGDRWLTREQGAKFFSVFKEEVLEETDTVSSACTFSDAAVVDKTLSASVIRSCELGLFKGTNGAFFPQQPLTKAQALTVLIRALEGLQPEDLSPRWKQYHARAMMLGLTKQVDVRALDKPVTRYEMALLLHRAVHGSPDPDLADMTELEQLLLELGLLRN